MTTEPPVDDRRLERVLAYMVIGCVGLSIAAFLAVMIGTMSGAYENDGYSHGVWPFIIMLPWVGLPLGFLLLVALLITNVVHRSREAKQNES